ncbi:MAG: DUF4123 domain-containing protein [Rhodospirillaceae bacterium]
MVTPALAPDAVRRLFQVLYPEPFNPEAPSFLYAVLDAARDPAIYRALYDHEGEVPIRCLYQGDLAQELSEVAPYLVQLDREAPFTAWLLENSWGNSWGILARSPELFDEVRRHFRKFTIVSTEAGKSLLFRFYDPRVLRNFLPIATPDQVQQLFGVIEKYVLEDEDRGTGVTEFTGSSGMATSMKQKIM